MCCTFNMAAAEEMFEKTQYTEMVEKMQKNDGNLSFFNDTLPNWYKENGKCFTFYFSNSDCRIRELDKICIC